LRTLLKIKSSSLASMVPLWT